jgi:dTDP-4-dehydrorhamnose reductase
VKVLIIASEGHIQRALSAQFTARARSFTVVAPHELSCGPGQKPCEFDIRPEFGLVINTLSIESFGLGAGDDCLEQLSTLSQACERARVPMLMLSSDEVFDGAKDGPRRERECIDPVDPCGKLLAQMELWLSGTCSRHIILRVGPVFSAEGGNVLTDLVARLQDDDPLSFSNSGKCCPVFAGDLARVISAMVDQLSCGCKAWGIYHYCSPEPVTHFQFAEVVLALASQYQALDCDAESLKLEQTVDLQWQRPLLCGEKILNTFGIKKIPWRSFLPSVVKTIFVEASLIEVD